jgi:uncharacterized membrane protein YhhN
MAAAGLGSLLLAEKAGLSRLRLVAKPSASAGFLLVALGSGALDSSYGTWIFAGLVLSMIGDLLLLFEDPARFRAGLVAFLVGHLAYIGAFAEAGVALAWTAVAAVGVLVMAAGVLPWLLPHVGGGMRGPVLAYVAVISAMMALAVGTQGEQNTSLIVGGAGLFYVSDLFVARERFVTTAFWNQLIGLPLYYGGQVLLALSVGG